MKVWVVSLIQIWIEQIGWRGLIRNLQHEAPQWAALLPALPRLVHQSLTRDDGAALRAQLAVMQAEQARHSRYLFVIALALIGIALLLI